MALRQPESSPQPPESIGDAAVRLLALVEHDPELALRLLAVLEESGIADSTFVGTERARLNLARGDRGTLIDHGASGAELTPQQAVQLLAEALAGTPVPPAAIANAVSRGLPLSQRAKGQLISAIRASHDRGASVGTYEAICTAAGKYPGSDHAAIVDLGVELVDRIGATAGEASARKILSLRTVQATIALVPNAVGRMLDEALKVGVVRSYDVVHDKKICTAAVTDDTAAKAVVNRAKTNSDLEAAAQLIPKIADESRRGRYLRALFKRYGDDHEPTRAAAESVATGLDALVALHAAAPSTDAASHDEALLRRWAHGVPELRQRLSDSADRIAIARAPFTQRYKAAHAESEQTLVAKRFVKEQIVPSGQIILLVGGSFTKDLINAFNEFHPPTPTWGDWIFKDRSQPLKAGEVDERVASPKCAGVVIIMKPAGHMIVEQAKVAVQRHGKPSVTITNSSKSALRDGLRSLLVRMAREIDPKVS